MKKIYLAISETEGVSLLQNELKIKDSELITLKNKDEVDEVLNNKSFYMMFISVEYLPNDILTNDSLEGILYIYDSTNHLTVNDVKNIRIYSDVKKMVAEALLESLANIKIIKEKAGTKPIQQASPPIIEAEIDRKKEEVGAAPIQPQEVKQKTVVEKPKDTNGNEFDNPRDNDKGKDKPIQTNVPPVPNTEVIEVQSEESTLEVKEVENDEYSMDYISNRINESINDDIYVKPEYNLRIGVWSPLQRVGVSSFILNFAIFLSTQHKFDIAVVENINNKPRLKSLLTRYHSQPKEWASYPDVFINKNIPTSKSRWTYKNVSWFPLGDTDSQQKWNEKLLIFQFGKLKKFNLVFVDLPTGPMEKYTKDTLKYLDELWIMVDDSPDQLAEWKKVMKDNIQSNSIKTKLLFNRQCSNSKAKGISKLLDIPLLTTFPTLHNEYVANQYSNKPLIEKLSVYYKLIPSYRKLEDHLLNSKKRENYHPKKFIKKLNDYYRWLIDIKLK
jgi:hypothetical protein